MKEKKDKELIMKHDGVLNFPIDKTGDYKREANFPSSACSIIPRQRNRLTY